MISATSAGIGLAGFLPLAAFSWGVRSHFRQTGRMAGGMRAVSLLSLGGFLWFAWRLWDHGSASAWPAAVLLFGLSLALFFWAVSSTARQRPTLAFETDRPVFLVREGPYRHVRHPFYTSYLIYWVGTALATPGMPGWLVPLVMIAVYAHAATVEERKFAASSLAGDYAAYRRKAGMFVPNLRFGGPA